LHPHPPSTIHHPPSTIPNLHPHIPISPYPHPLESSGK
jgi:hypothetical protein